MNLLFNSFALCFIISIRMTASFIFSWSGFMDEIDIFSGRLSTANNALTANWSTVAKCIGNSTASKPEAPAVPSPLIERAIFNPETISSLSKLKILCFIKKSSSRPYGVVLYFLSWAEVVAYRLGAVYFQKKYFLRRNSYHSSEFISLILFVLRESNSFSTAK